MKVETIQRGGAMDKLYIVMPVYNEEENIQRVIAQWHPVVEGIGPQSRLVLIYDGSQDNTYSIAAGLKEIYPQLAVYTKENQGHGPTVLRGYRYAIRHGADYVFQTDSDGQTLPSEFSKFWRNRSKCGILLGNRKKREDGLCRAFISKGVLRSVLLAVFHVWEKDANVPYRLMKCSQLKEVLQKVPKNFFLANVLITIIYRKNGMGVCYYPITFLKRQGGKNTINMKKIFRIGMQAVRQFAVLRKRVECR